MRMEAGSGVAVRTIIPRTIRLSESDSSAAMRTASDVIWVCAMGPKAKHMWSKGYQGSDNRNYILLILCLVFLPSYFMPIEISFGGTGNAHAKQSGWQLLSPSCGAEPAAPKKLHFHHCVWTHPRDLLHTVPTSQGRTSALQRENIRGNLQAKGDLMTWERFPTSISHIDIISSPYSISCHQTWQPSSILRKMLSPS